MRQPGREWQVLALWLLVQDAALLLVAFGLAYALRFEAAPMRPSAEHGPDYYRLAGAAIVAGWLGIFALLGLYRRATLLGGYREYARAAQGCLYGALGVAAASYLLGGSPVVSRGYLGASWLLAGGLILLGRAGCRRGCWRLRARGLFVRRALVVGAGRQAAELARHLGPAERSGVRILGFASDYLPVGTPVTGGLRVLGAAAQARELARHLGADELVVVARAVSAEVLEQILEPAEGGPEVRLLPTQAHLAAAAMRAERAGSVTLLVPERRAIAGSDALMKAAIEMPLCWAALVLLSPWLLWLRLRRGPFRRIEVQGRRGRAVWMLAAPGRGAPRGAARIPALWNVAWRELALVGPEPRTADQPRGAWAAVLAARPGLVGLGGPQGEGRAAREARLALELAYLQNYSPWLDLQSLAIAARRALVGIRERAAGRHVEDETALVLPLASKTTGLPRPRLTSEREN